MLRTSSKLFVWFSLMLCISLVLTIAPSPADAADTINIGDARALPLGSTVTIKGTVTVASGAFVSSSFDEGFAIQAHSKSHGDMVRASAEGAAEYDKRLEAELVQPKALFQKNLGYAPDIIAYPYGRQDDTVVRRAKERGYIAAFTVRRQGSQSFVDPHRIHRIQIYPEMRMDDFVKSLSVFSQESIK
jgi:peptidoglycan/xylan/chitin deacetylase (PgdA/CDA1 family)